MGKKEKLILNFTFLNSKKQSERYLEDYYINDTVTVENLKNQFYKILEKSNKSIKFDGGQLFCEKSFSIFKIFLGQTNSKNFYIIEDTDDYLFSFQYPSSILWEDLNKSSLNIEHEGITWHMFNSYSTNYLIFSEEKNWGIYVSIDEEIYRRIYFSIEYEKFAKQLVENWNNID